MDIEKHMLRDGSSLTKTTKEDISTAWQHQAAKSPTRPTIELSSIPSYRYIFLKRRWLILGVAITVTVLVSTYSVLTKPEYRSTARILVDPDQPDIRTMDDLFRSGSPNDDTFLATQVNVLQSDNLVWQTIVNVNLRESPEFSNPKRPHSAATSERPAELIAMFKDRLSVERKRDTRMIEVSFESHDPRLAASVANNLVHNYIDFNFQMKFDATQQTTGWMKKQLDELKNKVEQSGQALVDYERKNSIFNVGDKESVAAQKLTDLSHDLTQAQSDRIQKESLFDLASSTKSQVGAIAQDDLLQKLEERDADLRQQYSDALGQYGETFPKASRLKTQIDDLQTLIERARKRMVEHMRNDFSAGKARETLLASAVARQKVEVERFNQLLVQHDMLKHDFASNQRLYENLLQRLKDASVSAGLRATNIHVVDEAISSSSPIRPQRLRNALTALGAGLILGFLVAMIRETLDSSVKDAGELERLIAVPVLASIPSQHPSLMSSKRDDKVELALLHQPQSAVSEAFRGLRTSLLFSMAAYPPKALLITSAHTMEGKTCVSFNLALTLAQKSSRTMCVRPEGTYVCDTLPHRVLLIDGDLRNPGITVLLGLSEGPGLGNVLTGDKSLEECIRPLERQRNLYVLPAGPIPPNPAELLGSPSMDLLLRLLRMRFSYVIIDSPPVMLVTDATVLSTLADGVVMVVESEKTGRDALLRACGVVTNAGGRILGTALNKVPQTFSSYYGRYQKSGPLARLRHELPLRLWRNLYHAEPT